MNANLLPVYSRAVSTFYKNDLLSFSLDLLNAIILVTLHDQTQVKSGKTLPFTTFLVLDSRQN